ncbi:MAG: hypothetical protein V4615_15865, partial [Bacteroidota bacterium]
AELVEEPERSLAEGSNQEWEAGGAQSVGPTASLEEVNGLGSCICSIFSVKNVTLHGKSLLRDSGSTFREPFSGARGTVSGFRDTVIRVRGTVSGFRDAVSRVRGTVRF